MDAETETVVAFRIGRGTELATFQRRHRPMLGELSRLIAMVGVTAKNGIRTSVHDRVKTGKCIIKGCDCEIAARGLCNKHYVAFVRELQSRPKKERPEFEASAIREGKILASQEMRQIRKPNPFADL